MRKNFLKSFLALKFLTYIFIDFIYNFGKYYINPKKIITTDQIEKKKKGGVHFDDNSFCSFMLSFSFMVPKN